MTYAHSKRINADCNYKTWRRGESHTPIQLSTSMKPTHRITWLFVFAALMLAGYGVFGIFSRATTSVAAQFSGSLLYTHANQIWQWRDGNNSRISVAGKAKPDAPASDPEELETQPAWSPDGTKLAYVRYGDSYSDVVVANANGSNVVRLTNDFSSATPGTQDYVSGTNWAFGPSWRPDGQRLAFLHDKGSDPLAVWSMASVPDDTSYKRLSPAAISNVGFERPQWSPNNDSIIATNYESSKAEIWKYVIDSDTWISIIKADEADYDPTWSPDGKYIAYAAQVGGKNSIWVAHADGSGATQLIGNGDIDKGLRSPAWSPGGNAIAYLKMNSNGFNLFAVSLDTSGGGFKAGSPQQLTNDNLISGTGGLSWGK